MSFESFVQSNAAAWLTSEKRLNLNRLQTEIGRRMSRKGHEILYFHRVDDPYCQLMVQVLPDLISRFDVIVKPLVVERLPANMYPDPARYEAYSILDATRLARLYGLGFPSRAKVPDRFGVGMANRYLASIQGSPDFFAIAEEVGAALWREDIASVKRLCVAADIHDSVLAANEQLLRSLGHYASGTLIYGGEIYLGLDRMDHLERRLNRLGIGDGEVHYELGRLWRYNLEEPERSVSGKTVELFFSVRSPYSYIALHQASEFAAKTGVRIKLRPVLPMVMRGLAVPPAKARYILDDAAREARLENIPFGRIVDPLGGATNKAMAIGFALATENADFDFFKAFTKAVWAEGIDGNSEKGMATILEKIGLPSSRASTVMPLNMWQEKAERNRQQMLMYGSWGVPAFRVGTETLWGQDRLWAIMEALKQSAAG
ncbi:DsbA family protein [Kordiimonas pumila]|uniref:DsbA family protein n=1 Tax=Kordiimonas pumila TaxID=2161677 RepID=A0ABV7D988_9PROT|nr:DsbA family protein [Kordiimonas pumila]